MSETLILVDEHDQAVGAAEKMQVHVDGLLHRAFSIMIFNDKGQLLIQKRAATKYHSAGLWANTCCGHPRPHEEVSSAAQRRLQEELGFTCKLAKITTVQYALKLENGLHEHEYTHVFAGYYKGAIYPNPEEASEVKWDFPSNLRQASLKAPNDYARWFILYLQEYYDAIFTD